MNEPAFLGLVQNIALLLASVLIFDPLIVRDHTRLWAYRQIGAGFLLGAIGVAVILTPWVLIPDFGFDTNSVLLGISGLFFGTIPTLIAMGITAAFRIYQGGSGVLTGVLVILAAGTLGLIWRRIFKHPVEKSHWIEFYLFGIVSHLIMLALMFTLPGETALRVLKNISLPVLVLYPLGTVILGMVISNRIRREQIQEVLSKMTNRLNATQHLTRMGGWEYDLVSQSMFWTDEVYHLHGISPGAIPSGAKDHIQRSILHYNPEDRPVIQTAFENCVEKGIPYDLEFLFNPLQGEQIWVRTQAEAIWEEGKIVRVMGNIMDITERKLAEEAISASEEKYRLLIKNSHDIIYTLNVEGVFTFVSPAWTELLCHPVSQVIGQPFQKFVHPDDIPACMVWLKKVIETGARQAGMEYRVRHLNGTWYWHTSSAVPLWGTPGTVIGFEGTARDITERKIAEENLRRVTHILESTRAILSSHITSAAPEKTFDAFLQMLISETGSEFSFLDEVLVDQDGSLYKLNLSMSNISWDDASKKLYEDLRARRLEFRNLQNLAGMPALTGKLYISNNPQEDPNSGGIPYGHPPIKSFMGLPLYFGDQLVGVAGVANRSEGYNEEIARSLEPFLSACASVIHAQRLQIKEREAVAALQENEEKFRLLYENINEGVALHEIIKDENNVPIDFIFLSANPTYERLTKLRAADIIGKRGLEVIPNLEKKWIDAYGKVAQTGQPVTLIDHSDYLDKYWEVRAFSTKQNQFAVALSDITERIQADKLLQESNEIAQAILNASTESVFLMEIDGVVLAANETTAVRMGKHTAAELIGTNIYDWLPREVAEFRKNQVTAVIEEGKPLRFEDERLGVWIENSIYPIFDPDGQVRRLAIYGRDITERRKMEAALANEADFTQRIFNSTDAHMAVVDPNGIILAVNEKWRQFALENTGLDETTWGTGANYFVQYGEEWGETTLAKEGFEGVRKVQTGQLPSFSLEYPCHGPGDEKRWFVMLVVPFQGNDGTVLISHSNITERKLAEDAQHMSEMQFRIVFEKTSVGYTLTNLDGKYFRVNQALADMLGYTAEEMARKHWTDFMLAEDIQTDQDMLAPLLTGEQNSIAVEKRYLRKDDSKVDVYISTTLLRDAQNAPMYFIMNVLDISERKKTEAELRESEERFKSLHNASFGGIAIHDKGIILECNLGLSDMMGYSLDELLGMDGLLLIAPESRDFVRSNIARGYEKPYEAFGMRKNGEIFPMRLEARNVPYKGKNVRTVEFRDITESKLIEEKIHADQVQLQRLLAEAEHSRQALLSVVEDQKEAEDKIRRLNAELEQRVKERTAQLEVVNHELEAFSYSISHDLRAPLRAMDGFSNALLLDYPDKLDAQGKHYLVRIHEASLRMGQLIEDLLNLSRISRREINLSRVDLSQIARQVADELKAQSPDQTAEFKIAPGLIVQGDPGLLRIALENLLHNAFKYSSKQEVSRVEVGVLDQPGTAEHVFFVRDNGAGFDMAYAHKLFTPFQRLHGINEYAGTGIGLTIVQRIISRHGGRIWPEAAVNQGATFYFTVGAG